MAATKGVGPKTLWLIADYLASRNKTASWLLENPEKINDILFGNKTGITIAGFADQEDDKIEKSKGGTITVLHPLHPDFPQQIRTFKNNISLPAILYVIGNIALLNRPSVSIVGRRDAEKPVLAAAESLACELAGKGINITSGYAAGIDSAAHLAALRAGGTTSIVLAEGIVHFQTKPELRNLLKTDNSLIISQSEPETKWAAYMAMTRNKLVCVLSGAVVVIASGPERDANGRNSGTYNTAMAALKMGVPVFVITPCFFSDQPEGNRQLIARGCRAWDPATGAASILAASTDKKPLPRQLGLFEKTCD